MLCLRAGFNPVFVSDDLIISKIPEDWLLNEGDFLNPDEIKNAYDTFFLLKCLFQIEVNIEEKNGLFFITDY